MSPRNPVAVAHRYTWFAWLVSLVLACSSQPPAAKVKPSRPEITYDDKSWEGGFKLLLGGDFGFADTYQMSRRVMAKLGYEHATLALRPFFEAADYTVVNLETPITDLSLKPYRKLKTYVHRGMPSLYQAKLGQLGIDAASLANNHAMDCGPLGLEDTEKYLKEAGVRSFGAGRNVEEAVQPLRFAAGELGEGVPELAIFAGLHYTKTNAGATGFSYFASPTEPGVARLDSGHLLDAIAIQHQKNPESLIIVFPHWGTNYKWRSKKQKKSAARMFEAGADLVLGHGPHMAQTIDKGLVYSLGNLLFTTPGRFEKVKKAWPYSLVAMIRFGPESPHAWRMRLYPIQSDNLVTNYQTRPVNLGEFHGFLDKLKRKSRKSSAAKLKTGQDRLGYFVEMSGWTSPGA